MPRLSNSSTVIALERCWQAEIGDYVIALSPAPGGGRLAAASIAGPISIFDTATGGTLHELPGHRDSTLTLDWNANGETLVSGGADGTFQLWNADAGTRTATLDAGAAWGEHAAWRSDGTLLATGAGRHLRLWDEHGELIREFEPHPSTIAALCWAPKHREISTACYGGLYFWARHQSQPVRSSELKSSLLALAWSPDGRYAAAGEQSGSVHLWRSNGKGELEMAGYPYKVKELAWSADSRWLATAGDDNPVLWDLSGRGPAGQSGRQLEGHDSPITALAFHTTSDLLACGDEQGRICLYSPGARRRPLGTVEIDEPVSALHWATDGATLIAAGGLGALAAYERT